MTTDSDHNWGITAHVCRICLGRVLARVTFDGRTIFRCSNCGVEREGADETVICTCGLKLKTKIDAGIRCTPNDQKSPECVSEIIATQVQPS